MRILLFFICFMCGLTTQAQTITGQVVDAEKGSPMFNVAVQNVHTSDGTFTDSAGRFQIAAAKGQLVEFRKLGYKIGRVRLPEGNIPPFFKIVLQLGAIELEDFELHDRNRNYTRDSIRNRELYGRALDFPKMSTLDVINHPFSALSKRNRQIWAFQREYELFEKEKFIDYSFNEQLVENLTGLRGDSANVFVRRFRPTYEQLRAWNQYDFFNWVKQSVERYRRGRR